MLVNVLRLAIHPIHDTPRLSFFQERRDACTYTRGSVRRASGFVLTGNPETGLQRVNLEFNQVEPFACFAFPPFTEVQIGQKWLSFDDELVTSFSGHFGPRGRILRKVVGWLPASDRPGVIGCWLGSKCRVWPLTG